MRTPPGIAPDVFAQALKEFAAAVGPQWVFTSDEDLDLYRDAYSPLWGEAEERIASAAVAPDGVEQVQAIVRIAGRYKVPLYAISTGRNLAYGGSAPAYSGSVVLDLKRMNRVIEVNEENAYALVEPGVSYFDLYRHIREKGLKLWIDCPDPGWGSPIGNALDHGAGYTPLPYRDHFDAHCGMEVVLGTGEVVRTGMGALPDAKTWQQFRYGIGPTLDGLFAQSNFGVVTKMGFWLYPEPEAARVCTVKAQKHDDIIPFVRVLARLMYEGTVNCQLGLVSPVWHKMGPLDPELDALMGRAAAATPAEWDAYAAAHHTHFWECGLHFYGPAKVVDAQWEHAKDSFSVIPGVSFEDGPAYRFPMTDEEISTRLGDRGPMGVPSLGIFAGLLAETGLGAITGHMDLSPVTPMTGEAVIEIFRTMTPAFRELGVRPWYGTTQSFHWRAFVTFYGFPVTHDAAQNQKTRAAYHKMIQLAAEHGWGLYRTHAAFQDAAVAAYSWGDHALLRLQERLKDAIDPDGILSPGRYGIWPSHLRSARP